MKRAAIVLFCACKSAAPEVEIAAPLSRATVAPAHDEVALPRGAKPVVVKEDGAWAASFPASKTFAVYDLPDARRVLLAWQIGKYHVVKQLDEGEDYPSNHVAPVDLVVSAKGDARTVAFGELSGSAEPYALSWCAKGETPDRQRAFASTFSIGTAQGDDEFAIVRDGRTLHVLHRQTTDGACDEEGKQGPLDVCTGSEWERMADVRMATDSLSHVELFEIVQTEGKTLDCDPE